MKFKKFYPVLASVVFVAFLAVMAVLLLLTPPKDYSENEKRFLAGRPEVTGSAIMKGTVQTDLEKFTADQIPGRNFFVGVNAYWNLVTGRNGAQDIYHAKDNYLINAPKPVNQEVYTANLTRFDAFAASLGRPADLLMVPSTGYIMEDKLPAFHGVYHDDELFDQAQASLQTLHLLDVRQVLKDGAAQEQVCYRTDHHLTAFGNYLLYQTYQSAVGGQSRPREAYTITSYDGFYGTTWSGSGYWLTPADAVEIWDGGFTGTVTLNDGGSKPEVTSDRLFFRSHLDDLDKYPTYLDGNHALVTIQNPQAPGGSLLVVRDSYAHCMGTFLADQYQTIYLVDLRYYREVLSDFVATHPVDRILFVYGIDNMISDTNSAWLK